VLNLKGKKAFIAGIGDDQGYGWAIAKALFEAGAEIIVGTWPPVFKIFKQMLSSGKFDQSRKLLSGKLMEFLKIYPLDATFDRAEDVPLEILENKRYQGLSAYTVSEVANLVQKDFGTVDILVHSLANAPEVKTPLSQTSRAGYLAALSASSFSFVSLLRFFEPFMPNGGSALSLTYIAAQKAIPGYGGGMSSAKAALESDTRTLAWEFGRKKGIRVNTVSAGPLRSRAAKAIGFIENMVQYSKANAPLVKELDADEIGSSVAFLCSSLASAITGVTLHVDNGLHAMGMSADSPTLVS
jgi:enoyl-[acyl-carrier protein] reductase I